MSRISPQNLPRIFPDFFLRSCRALFGGKRRPEKKSPKIPVIFQCKIPRHVRRKNSQKFCGERENCPISGWRKNRSILSPLWLSWLLQSRVFFFSFSRFCLRCMFGGEKNPCLLVAFLPFYRRKKGKERKIREARAQRFLGSWKKFMKFSLDGGDSAFVLGF